MKGYWYDLGARKCLTCGWDGTGTNPNVCIDCVALTKTCRRCNSGLRLVNNSCVKCDTKCSRCKNDGTCELCAPGFWNNGVDCVTCEEGCLDCDYENKKCRTCSDLYWLDQVSEKCVKCPENCFNCDSTGKCLECQLNSYFVGETDTCVKTVSDFCAEYSLEDGKCVNCQAYSYFDPANSTCVPYSENCLDVNEDKVCISCKGKTYLNP